MKEEDKKQLPKAVIAMIKVKNHFHDTKERSGTIECPCGGELHYGIVSGNNHVRAKCDSCGLSFME